MSTSIEHELTKRALESIILVSSSVKLLSACFASNKLNNFSFLWLVCQNVSDFDYLCDMHVSVSFYLDDLCVATNMMNNYSF